MKNETKIKILKIPVIGWIFLTLFRSSLAFSSFVNPVGRLFGWLFTSREVTNFTYDLTDRNNQHLASLVSVVTGKPRDEIFGYIEELLNDDVLRAHIKTTTESAELAFMSDADARYGRRLGWYALARALKPKVIVETGVDKGLGSCVLTTALLRNREEGFEGRFFGTDINPKAGYLLSGDHLTVGKILYGDSIESLSAMESPIDLFINDSDHSADYEAREYDTINSKLSENGVVLGDNAHVTNKLLEYSTKNDRNFVFFQEDPKDHWYPGAGIGISFKKA